jgi:hypothetical protein
VSVIAPRRTDYPAMSSSGSEMVHEIEAASDLEGASRQVILMLNKN